MIDTTQYVEDSRILQFGTFLIKEDTGDVLAACITRDKRGRIQWSFCFA